MACSQDGKNKIDRLSLEQLQHGATFHCLAGLPLGAWKKSPRIAAAALSRRPKWTRLVLTSNWIGWA